MSHTASAEHQINNVSVMQSSCRKTILNRLSFILLSLFFLGPAKLTATDPRTTGKFKISYYTFSSEIVPLRNFSCLLNSQGYRDFRASLGDTSGYYPLKFIWSNRDQVYFILQPDDFTDISIHEEKNLEKILAIRKLFLDFYANWKLLMITDPFTVIPDSAKRFSSGDTVFVVYEPNEDNRQIKIQLEVSTNGLLTGIQETAPSEKVITLPAYATGQNQVICSGWSSRIFRNDTLIHRSSTRLKLKETGYIPVPSRADILSPSGNNTLQDEMTLYFKNFKFNLPLQELESP